MATQIDLDNLNKAINSGVLKATIEGQHVTYRHLNDMLRVRTQLEKQLGLPVTPNTAKSKRYNLNVCRGF